MTGHKHIGALQKDIRRSLNVNTKIDKIKEVYRFSFVALEIDDIDQFIFDEVMKVTPERIGIMTEIKQPFSDNEMDYGFEFPEYNVKDVMREDTRVS